MPVHSEPFINLYLASAVSYVLGKCRIARYSKSKRTVRQSYQAFEA